MTTSKLYKPDEEIAIDVKHDDPVPVQTSEVNDSVVHQPVQNDQLFENIKSIFAEEKTVVARNDTYFTPTKGVFEFKLDGTIFMPSHATLLQPRKFEELYLKELESIIYNSKEQLDTDKLLPLIILFSHLNKKNYPIRIVSGNYRKLLSKVCSVLNNFLNKNYAVIRSIYESFNSIKDTQQEQDDFRKRHESQLR